LRELHSSEYKDRVPQLDPTGGAVKNILLELTNIVQSAALIKSPVGQVKLIVDSISQVINVEVCSLYILGQDKESILLASHGLKNFGKISIPPGAGLVGLVAQTRHPVNTANAAKHPNYYYVKKAEEDSYKSFCGVPLVRLGEVIGVLVVQSTRARKLSDQKEAFLVTLASNLARFDCGFWSLYELRREGAMRMLASSFYHRLHIVQLQVMHRLTGEAVFLECANRWERYGSNPAFQIAGLAHKAAFKLLHY